MANGPLSPVMLIASDGMLQIPSTTLKANNVWYGDYQSIIQTGPVLTQAIALNAANIGAIGTGLLADLTTIGYNTVPALGDSITTAIANIANAINNTATFTQVIESRGDQLLGSGDISIFAQVWSLATNYVRQCDEYINSANNTNSIGSTFTSMDNLTTGSLSQVTSEISRFGQDLAAVGITLDLARLQYLGHPWLLVRQILQGGGLLPELDAALKLAGVTEQDVLQIQSNQPSVAANLDLKIYRALQSIRARALSGVCDLLDVTLTVNGGGSAEDQAGSLETAADLLDPKKLLPNTWPYLLVSLPSGTVNIYTAVGSISQEVESFFQADPAFLDLSRIIPSDQAMANLAWARSLAQVKNVINQTLPNLALAASTVQSNDDLPYIQGLDSTTGPVPADVKANVYSILGTGSGPNGLLYVTDLLGSCIGRPWIQLISNVTTQFSALANLSVFTDVTVNYSRMVTLLDGGYGNLDVGPINIPGDPTVYPDAGSALSSLIANAVANIAVFQSTRPTESSELNQSWTALTDQLTREVDNCDLAQIDLTQLVTNRSAVLSLGTGLHSIGENPDQSDFFTQVANAADPAGQAVLSSLREARNRASMLDAGFGIDTQLSAS